MPIQVGQALPNATLYEFFDEETGGCSIGPNALQVSDLIKGKKNCHFWPAGCVHSDLFCQACTRLCRSP